MRRLFSDPDAAGTQGVKLRSVGLRGMRGDGRTGEDLLLKKEVRLHAGAFDDPFFFDRDAFLWEGGRALCDGGTSDSFARREASAVVLEVPLFGMGTPTFGLWARTRAFGNQVDRMGFAGINGLLVPEHARGAFNRGQPKNDVVVFPR
ncbi:MAG: hypothetical protein P8R42_23485 [Candidatus Binatia bacterium]|nr:hypothetical protein [Candidatus Binatia bacterium]